MLLTLDAGSGRQRSRDDDDSGVFSCGPLFGSREH